MGDKVTIKVMSANLAKRQLDYEWVIAAGLSEQRKESKEIGNADRGNQKSKKKKDR